LAADFWIGASRNREFFEAVMDDLETMLGQYIRAQLLLSFLAFVAYGTLFIDRAAALCIGGGRHWRRS